MRAFTLAQVRQFMSAQGIETNHDIAVARKRVNPHDMFLPNMVVALSQFAWGNTPEEWMRLEAGLMILAARRKAARSRK